MSGTSLLPPEEHSGSAGVERGSAGVERIVEEGGEILQGRQTVDEGCGAAYTPRTNNGPARRLEGQFLLSYTGLALRRPGAQFNSILKISSQNSHQKITTTKSQKRCFYMSLFQI